MIFSPKGGDMNKSMFTKGNSSMLQDVSNKVSSFMNKIFKKKKNSGKDGNPERVLSPDFLNEINLQTAPDLGFNFKDADHIINKNFDPVKSKHLRR